MLTSQISKKLSFLCLLWVLSFTAFSQGVKVEESTVRILTERIDGYRTKLEAPSSEVESYLKSALRDLGKVRDRNTYFQITDVNLYGDRFAERLFFAQLVTGTQYQSVWFGVDSTGLSEIGWKVIDEKLQQYCYDFSINFYKDQVQKEIDESEKAEQYVLRQQKKLEKDSVSLLDRIDNNAAELIKLQQAIEDNKAEKELLLQKIKENKIAQDSTVITLDKVRKVIEMQKKKKEEIK